MMRAPVDGRVAGVQQIGPGTVVSGGRTLMELVPNGRALVIEARVKPQDIDEVRMGMKAKVRLSGLNQRWTDPVPAQVVTISADRLVNQHTGEEFFGVDLRIDPKDLRHLPKGLKLSPGMPADAMIVTGKRTIMGFLATPILDTFHNAFRED